MNSDLLTQLVRATNNGIVPAPLPGEDVDSYKFRAACAGAVVAARWYADRDAQPEEPTPAPARAAQDQPDTGDDQTSQGRPSDVTVTSPLSPDNPYGEVPAHIPMLGGSALVEGRF